MAETRIRQLILDGQEKGVFNMSEGLMILAAITFLARNADDQITEEFGPVAIALAKGIMAEKRP